MRPRWVLLGLLCIALTGCVVVRATTTPRTAIEQALLSQSAETAVAALAIPELKGKTFYLRKDFFEAFDGKYVLSLIHARLLAAGMHGAAPDTADVLVYPSVANAAIDEQKAVLGVPEVPFVIPGAAAITLPEMVLLGREVQRGRSRLSLVARYRESGALAFQSPLASTEKFYSRWRLLFLISFRRTDLSAPF